MTAPSMRRGSSGWKLIFLAISSTVKNPKPEI